MKPPLQWLCTALLVSACPATVGGGGRPEDGPVRVELKSDTRADRAYADALATLEREGPAAGVAALLSVRKAYPATMPGEDALFRAGALAYEAGDFASARSWLNELVYENPVHPRALQARLLAGLAAVALRDYREASLSLRALVERLQGEDRRRCEEGLARAAAGLKQHAEPLRRGLEAVERATSEDERRAALARLETVVESESSFLAVAEAWHGLPSTHPAWPLLSYKLARVHLHLRDWKSLDATLQALVRDAPASPYAVEAKTLLERLARRSVVAPRRIGAILPLTGSYQAWGESVQRGLKLALDGSDIELVVADSKGDATLAGQAVEQLALDQGVIAIVGPLLPDAARRASFVAEELQVPIVTLSRAEGLTGIGPHVFRTMLTNRQQAEALAEYATRVLGYKTFAVLAPETTFGHEMTERFWEAVEARGGQMRGAEVYSHDSTTFTAEVKKLVGRYYIEDRGDYAEKLRELRGQELGEFRRRKAIEKIRDGLEPIIDFEALLLPDSWRNVTMVAPALAVEDIVTNACDRKDLERIQRTTGRDRLKTVTLLGPSTWSSPPGPSGELQLIERGQKYVLCSIYVDGFFEQSERPRTRAFVAAFRERNPGATLTLLDAVAWDTGALLRHVIERAQPSTRAALREQLATLRGFEGATGMLSFDANREPRRQLFYLNVTSKGVKELPPPPQEGS